MDVIKTALIACIAIVLYYLLLQWPTQANSPGEASSQMPVDLGSEVREIPSQIMIDSGSEDSLSRFETPVSETPKTPEKETTLISTSRLFIVENDTLLMEVDGLSGRFVSSKLKYVKNSKGGESNLGIFGSTGENFYFVRLLILTLE